MSSEPNAARAPLGAVWPTMTNSSVSSCLTLTHASLLVAGIDALADDAFQFLARARGEHLVAVADDVAAEGE